MRRAVFVQGKHRSDGIPLIVTQQKNSSRLGSGSFRAADNGPASSCRDPLTNRRFYVVTLHEIPINLSIISEK